MTTPRDFEAEIAELNRQISRATLNRQEAEDDMENARQSAAFWQNQRDKHARRLEALTYEQAQSRKAGGK
jgi:chromosome segregation ATPase